MNPLEIHQPVYKSKPIRLLSSLAKALGLSESELIRLSNRSNSMYRRVEVKDQDKVRITYDAFEELKIIQQRINVQILNRVVFPTYLTGAIKKRDYKDNASLHLGAKIIICEDISKFFPSTTQNQVHDIWRFFFKFSEEVAQCLTKLTTMNGMLPQGAKTSSNLSNLVFWRNEPLVHMGFKQQGITYSRYIDDVVISSKEPLLNEAKTNAVSRVLSLISSNGYKANRKKHELKTSKERMVATKLTVNTDISISRLEQSRIRAAVQSIEIMARENDFSEGFEKLFRSTMGRVNSMSRFHPHRAAQLKKRLNATRQQVEA